MSVTTADLVEGQTAEGRQAGLLAVTVVVARPGSSRPG